MTDTPVTSSRIGQTASIQLGRPDTGRFTVAVTVLEERKQFGRQEYRVTPVSGSGSNWVASIQFNDNEAAQ